MCQFCRRTADSVCAAYMLTHMYYMSVVIGVLSELILVIYCECDAYFVFAYKY